MSCSFFLRLNFFYVEFLRKPLVFTALFLVLFASVFDNFCVFKLPIVSNLIYEPIIALRSRAAFRINNGFVCQKISFIFVLTPD